MPKLPKPLAFIEPMAATSVPDLPRGPEWSYEVTLDGYCVLACRWARRLPQAARRVAPIVSVCRRVVANGVLQKGGGTHNAFAPPGLLHPVSP